MPFIIRYEHEVIEYQWKGFFNPKEVATVTDRGVRYIFEYEKNGLLLYDLTFDKEQACRFTDETYNNVRGTIQAVLLRFSDGAFYREDID